jgi:surfeit locus 1 family protein
MNALRLVFAKQNLFPTILVGLACLVMGRLGIWQLDRLEQRRAFNTRVLAWIYFDPIPFDQELVQASLYDMEYRSFYISGTYIFDEQVGLRLQTYKDRSGIHLITPLRLDNSDAILLVDRGWLPLEYDSPESWGEFNSPERVRDLLVRVRRESKPDFGSTLVDPTLEPDQDHLWFWYSLDNTRIEKQSGLDLVDDVYFQVIPQGEIQVLPQPVEPKVEISEGPHIGYAVQWFTFAAILLIGYPIFLSRQST